MAEVALSATRVRAVPPRTVPASRRAVIAGGAGVVAVAATGCGTADRAGRAASAGDPAVEADSDLVERMRTDLAEAMALVAATARAFPALRGLTRPLVALHRAHGEELGGLPDVEPAAPPSGPAPRARAALLAAEDRLQRRLVQAAVAAESGALAQTFAAMAAGVAQRRAVST